MLPKLSEILKQQLIVDNRPGAGSQIGPAVPPVPTFGEAGMKEFDASSYWGALAPARTPAEIVTRLSATIALVLKTPDVRY